MMVNLSFFLFLITLQFKSTLPPFYVNINVISSFTEQSWICRNLFNRIVKRKKIVKSKSDSVVSQVIPRLIFFRKSRVYFTKNKNHTRCGALKVDFKRDIFYTS